MKDSYENYEYNAKSKELLNFIFSGVAESCIIINSDGKIEYINNRAGEVFGFKSEEIIGQDYTKIISAEDISLNNKRTAATVKFRDWIDYFLGNDHEMVALDKNGSKVFFRASVSKLNFKNANLYLIIKRSISDKKFFDLKINQKLLNQIIESESRFKIIADSLPAMLWLADKEGQSFFFNKAWHDFRQNGYEDFGKGWYEAVHPEDREYIVSTYEQFIQKQERFFLEYRFKRYDDNYRWFYSTIVPRYENNEMVGFIGFSIDIQKRKELEEALKESEERFNLAAEGSNDGIWDWNMVNDEVYYSPQWKKMLGYENHELVNNINTWISLMHPDDKERILAKTQEYIEGKLGKYLSNEIRLIHKDRSIRNIICRGLMVKNAEGKPVRMVGSHTDITDYIKTLNALKRAQSIAKMGTWRNDFVTNTYSICPSAYEILDNPKVGLEFRPELFRNYIHPDDAEEFFKIITEAKDKKIGYKRIFRFVTDKGEIKYIYSAAEPYFNEKNELVAYEGIAMDITSQKKTENELRETEEKFNLAIRGTNDGIWERNFVNNNIWFSSRCKEIFGYADNEMENSIESWENIIFPEDKEETNKLLEDYKQGKINEFQVQQRYKHKNGSVVKIISRGMLIRNEKNEPIKIVGSITDITELQKAIEQAEAANKSKSLFLANISHELRTPMNGIIGLSSILLDSSLTDQQKSSVENILKSGEALLEIINDILDFSKIEAGKFEISIKPFSVKEAAEAVVDLLAIKSNEKQMDLIYNINIPNNLMVLGDEIRFKQVLNNLVGNAIKFTDKGYVFLNINVLNKQNGTLKYEVKVTDTGIGISEHKKQKLFNKFVQLDDTPKRKFSGTGLGLAISKDIVEMLGGKIELNSEEGKGSSFSFILSNKIFNEEEVNIEKKRSIVNCLFINRVTSTNEIIKENISKHNINLDIATYQGEVDLMLKSHKYKSIIIDHYFEYGDINLFNYIKKIKEKSECKIIFITSNHNEYTIESISKYGVDVVLNRPYKIHELADIILGNTNTDKKEFTSSYKILSDKKTFEAKILVAEDNIVNQQVVKALLSKFGCNVVIVENGVQAIKEVKENNYDLVLMDIQMPEMDGYEATKIIKTKILNGEIKDVPIVALTANAIAGDREKCLEYGMSDYISKPIKISNLEEILSKYLIKNN